MSDLKISASLATQLVKSYNGKSIQKSDFSRIQSEAKSGYNPDEFEIIKNYVNDGDDISWSDIAFLINQGTWTKEEAQNIYMALFYSHSMKRQISETDLMIILPELLKYQINLNYKYLGDDDELNPLHPLHIAATKFKKTDILELLLKNGADVNIKNKSGRTALHLSATRGVTNATETLIKHKANINAKDNHGSTPLDGAVRYGKIDDTKLLLQNGATIEGKDEKRSSALFETITYNRVEIAKLLLDHKANIEAKNGKGETPLLATVKESLRQENVGDVYLLLKLLLEHGANVEARDKKGFTSLHWEVMQAGGSKYTDKGVILLIKHGANLEAKDENGRTPLFFTIRDPRQGIHISKMESLLKRYGANVNARDHAGLTYLDCTFLRLNKWEELPAFPNYPFKKLFQHFLESLRASNMENLNPEIALDLIQSLDHFTTLYNEHKNDSQLKDFKPPQGFDDDPLRLEVILNLNSEACYELIGEVSEHGGLFTNQLLAAQWEKQVGMDPKKFETYLVEKQKKDPEKLFRFLVNLMRMQGYERIKNKELISHFLLEQLLANSNKPIAIEQSLGITQAFTSILKDAHLRRTRIAEIRALQNPAGAEVLELKNLLMQEAKDHKIQTGFLIGKEILSFAQKAQGKSVQIKNIAITWLATFAPYLGDEFKQLIQNQFGLVDISRKYPANWKNKQVFIGHEFLQDESDFRLAFCQTSSVTVVGGKNSKDKSQGLGYDPESLTYSDGKTVTFYKYEGKLVMKDSDGKEYQVFKEPTEDLYVWKDGKKENILDVKKGVFGVLTRTLDNGKVVKIKMQLGADNAKTIHLSDPNKDDEANKDAPVKIGIRGHHVQWPFLPEADAGTEYPERELTLLGCGGASAHYIEKMKSIGYSKAIYVGDSNRASGAVSNVYFARGLEAIALGVEISDVANHYRKTIPSHDRDGIVMPDDPFLRFKQILNSVGNRSISPYLIGEAQKKLDIEIQKYQNDSVDYKAMPQLTAGEKVMFKIKTKKDDQVEEKSYSYTIEAKDLDVMGAMLLDPEQQREVLQTLWIESGRGSAQSVVKGTLSITDSLLGTQTVHRVGDAQVDLDHGDVLEQAIRTRTAGWDMEKLPGTKKFLEKLNNAKATDKRDLYRSYFESREGAVVACAVLYTNLKDQMVSLYQSDYPDYLKNPLKHNLSPQWSKIKHSLYRDSAKILLNKHLKSHLLKIDEAEKWNITAPYAQDSPAKKETSFSLKALFREPPDTNPLSNGSYHEWMQEVAKKYLEKKGYTLVETIPPNLSPAQKEKHITNEELKTFLQLGNGSGMQSIYNHRLKKIFGIQWTEIPAPILKRGVFFEEVWKGWH